MAQAVRVGVIGLGSVSRVYIPHMQRLNLPVRRVEIVIASDIDPARHEIARAAHGLDDVVFTTGRDTVKGRNLLRDGRASLCVDDERPPFGYVVVSGRVTATAGASDLLEWATRIAERYMGAELADEYGSRNAVESELLVRLKAERLHGLARLAD